MQKAPDYERIRHTLRLAQDPLNSDELWVKRYLELADKVLRSETSASNTQPAALSA
jgi:hypothetical protein